jgi:hypothetical protein
VEEAERAGRSPQLFDLLDVLRAESGLRAVPAAEWLDVGSPDRQAASHRALLQKRSFNELHIDPVMGTITKRSHNVAKFIDEINYLRLLPPELQVLFPRIVQCSTSWSEPFVTLEYYGYPTLSEMWVYENLDPAIWRSIFLHLHAVCRDGFGAHKRPLPASAVKRMLWDKTVERIDAVDATSPLYPFLRGAQSVWINDVALPSWQQQQQRLQAAVDDIASRAHGTVIHGDMCFSNILYDVRARILKMLDPRGSFGDAGIYGDPRYDLAKLYHSVVGGYDLMVNDLFDVHLEGDVARLSLRWRPTHNDIADEFRAVFMTDAQLHRDVVIMTALLFASMIPLHADAPKRQTAMMVRALQLLDEGLRMQVVA